METPRVPFHLGIVIPRGNSLTRMVDMPREVGERLGPYYVYALIDPRNDKIFYVGKGKGQRLHAHDFEASTAEDGTRHPEKVMRIREIRSQNLLPRIDVIRFGLSEGEALEVEASLIDCIGLDNLTNRVRGHNTERGRGSLTVLVQRYGARPLGLDAPPAVLIRLEHWQDEIREIEPGYFRTGYGYRDGMTAEDIELQDSVRAWWKVDENRARNVGIAITVYGGITRGVFEIGECWLQNEEGRRAFDVVAVTSGNIFDCWVGNLGRNISDFFPVGGRNPIKYYP